MCWAQKVFLGVIFVLFSLQLLASCGQKGELFLPEAVEKAPAALEQDKDALKKPSQSMNDVPEVN